MLGSDSVTAEGTKTLLGTYLSAVLLVGLAANATLGWRWVDPVAALVIATVAAREGVQTWRGEGCCAPVDLAGTGGYGAGCACCAPAGVAGRGPRPDATGRPRAFEVRASGAGPMVGP